MKKNVLLLSVLLALMFTANVYAESSKFGIGARVGYNIYKNGSLDVYKNGSLDANLSSYGSLGNVDYSNQSVGFIGLNGTYQYKEKYSIELSIDRMIKSQSDFKASGVSYKGGDITQTAVLLTARYHFPVGMFSPYVGAGFGYYFNDYAKDNAFWNAGVVGVLRTGNRDL